MANHAQSQAQLPLPIPTDATEPSSYADASGRLYTEAQITRAKVEKCPMVREWIASNRQALSWLERSFLELAESAEDGTIGGNLLVYHLRYQGLKDASGKRMRRNVRVSNTANPVIARLFALFHPDVAPKLSLRPSVWDTEELQPYLKELAAFAAL